MIRGCKQLTMVLLYHGVNAALTQNMRFPQGKSHVWTIHCGGFVWNARRSWSLPNTPAGYCPFPNGKSSQLAATAQPWIDKHICELSPIISNAPWEFAARQLSGQVCLRPLKSRTQTNLRGGRGADVHSDIERCLVETKRCRLRAPCGGTLPWQTFS